MSTGSSMEIVQINVENEELLALVKDSKTAASGKCPVPNWVLPVLVISLILTILGATFAMGYFISYPRKSTKSLKLYNENCTVLSGECDSSRGLYCPSSQCVCERASSYYNGSSCVCPNFTHSANQECVPDGFYGQPCSPPTANCLSNFICDSTSVCACNATAEYFNGTYLPKQNGWQTCNNITTGTSASPCDDTLGLYCYSNGTCQCPNTMFWHINNQQCETKRLYGDICDADFYCNETLNFICPTVPGTCNCPAWSNDYTCDCQPNWFYDGLQCIQRKTINGTCFGTYACDINTPLVCFTGLCLCPTPTTWTGSNCTCSSGQTWTGSTCVAVG
ncbi:unnamed protein product [Rotaria sp. Silwood2]|nr:unnamed protein product [Rotaria sp. Silwood2]CAF2498446.1 unnamed protein product [Rotaria sp. Silwood2]CAF2813947.1 unnamed protein product [Rotaria sp. Silwood2]CAF2962893.1 unnamed protein product [Rotaria sp. Silwood2]CAF3920790.1 unnamed protein product [Rotaria sp. Silwood2]